MKLNPRVVWVVFFSSVNLICGIVIFATKSLLGETSGMGLDHIEVVPWITLLVIASYVILLLWAFPSLVRLKVRKATFSQHNLGNPVGLLLLILQIAYIAFFLITGTGVAGSTNRSDSALSPLFVLISVDPLLFLYYGFYRSSRLFFPNLIVWVLSNVLRGWNGIFIIIIFMESARLMRSGKLRFRHLLFATALVVFGYPVLWSLKWEVRQVLSNGAGGASLTALFLGVASSLGASGYFEVVRLALLGSFARLHLVSNVIAVFQNSHQLAASVNAGTVDSFWREGLPGLVLDRFSGIRTPDLGVALAQTIDPWHENNWNSNPGYVGWFFVLPWAIPLYLLYTLALGWLSIYLIKKLKTDVITLDMLWFAWCLYLIPGWIAAFTLFTFSICVFYLLHGIAALIFRWKSLLASRIAVAEAIPAKVDRTYGDTQMPGTSP